MGRGTATAVFLTGVAALAAAVFFRLDTHEAPSTVVVFDKPFSVSFNNAPEAVDPSPPPPIFQQKPETPAIPETQSVEKEAVVEAPPVITEEKTPAAPEKDTPVSLTPQICEKLLLSAALNGVDYVAGVDVDGKPVVSADYSPENGVVPADLPSNDAYGIEKTVKERVNDMAFTVNLKLAGVYSDGAVLESSSVPLVRVAVKNGNVYLNGTPVKKADEEKIKQACRRLNDSSAPATTPDSF